MVIIYKPTDHVVFARRGRDDVAVVNDVVLQVPLAGDFVEGNAECLSGHRRYQGDRETLQSDVERRGDFPSAVPGNSPDPQAPADGCEGDDDESAKCHSSTP